MGHVGYPIVRVAALAALLALAGAGAHAETYSSSAGGVSVGTFVVDGTNSVFRLTASTNAVTKQSGTGILLTSSTVAAPTTTVNCNRPPGNCNGNFLFTVSSPGLTALNVSNIAVTAGSGTITPPASQNVNPVTFRVNTSTAAWTVTFKVGFDVTVSQTNPGPATGNKAFPYSVQVGH